MIVSIYRVYDSSRTSHSHAGSACTHLVPNYRGMLCACRKPRSSLTTRRKKENRAKHARLSGTLYYYIRYYYFIFTRLLLCTISRSISHSFSVLHTAAFIYKYYVIGKCKCELSRCIIIIWHLEKYC